jgi:4-amino-4-deoxy-L-arabinose transferase-like glycosyltransferase
VTEAGSHIQGRGREAPGGKVACWSRAEIITGVALGVILLLAAVLRFDGLAWGRPFAYHPDEPAIVKSAIQMVASGDWNPHWFNYPSLIIDIEALIVALGHAFRGGPLDLTTPGLFPSEALPTQFGAFLAGRVVVAILGLLTIIVTFAIGRRLGGRVAGLAGALLLALLPLHIVNSRYVTTDVPVAFWSSFVAYATLRATAAPGQLRWWVAAALAVGLATSTKWNAAAIGLIPAIVYVTSRPHGASLGRWLVSPTVPLMLVAAVVGVLLPTPAILASPTEVASYVSLQAAQYGVPRWNEQTNGLLFQFHAATYDLPWIGGVVMALGLASLVMFGGRVGRVGVVLILLDAALLALPPTHYERNLLEATPLLAVGGGLLLEPTWTEVSALVFGRRKAIRALGRPMLGGLFAVAPVLTLQVDIRGAAALTGTDTRTVARDWILGHIPHHAIIGRELQTPQLTADEYRQRNQDPLWRRPLDWYRALGVNYLVVSGYNTVRVLGDPSALVANAFYEQVFTLPEVFRVDPDDQRIGYTIRIFRLMPIAGGP